MSDGVQRGRLHFLMCGHCDRQAGIVKVTADIPAFGGMHVTPRSRIVGHFPLGDVFLTSWPEWEARRLDRSGYWLLPFDRAHELWR